MVRLRSRNRLDDPISSGSNKRQSSVADKRPRFRKRYILLAFLLLIVAAIGVGAPMVASNRDLVVSSINKYAGIAPLRVDLESVSIGWFSPFQMHGLKLIDDKSGQELLQIDDVVSEVGLFSLVRNYNDLKTITIRGVNATLEVQPGTTSIEEAIKPLMVQASSSPSTGGNISFPSGQLIIEKAVVRARDSVDGAVWQISVDHADIPFPTKENPIPSIATKGSISSLVGNNASATGLFEVDVQVKSDAVATTADGKAVPPVVELQMVAQNVPLDWWSLVKRRLPSLPIDRVAGIVSLQGTASLLASDNWKANIEIAQVDKLQIIAPTLIGRSGANIQQLRVTGAFQMTPDRLIAQNTRMQSDIGTLDANVSLPWPLPMPSASKPWIDGADINVHGVVDVARLQSVAPDLIAMQEQSRLVSGQAVLTVTQKSNDQRQPVGQYRVELGKLVANVNGSTMQWDQALSAALMIQPGASGAPQFNADFRAEFCEISGQGDLQAGKVHANVNLDQLQQRLAKLFAFPVQQLSGKVDCDMQWQQGTDNRLEATGTLVTTPIVVVTKTGQMDEPAWSGELKAVGRVDQGRLIQIDKGHLALNAKDESLQLSVTEPISLLPTTPGVAAMPPANAQFSMVGDLAAWNRRVRILTGIDLGVAIAGRCDIKARGLADRNHAEIANASFTAESLEVNVSGVVMREPRLQGEFVGRVDSQNLSRLQVDRLLVQSASFAIQAVDAATPDGQGRQGQAAFRLDPKQLLSSMNLGAGNAATPISIEANVTGRMNWTLDSAALAWQLQADAEQLKVIQPIVNAGPRGTLASTGPANARASLLWEEPKTSAMIQGKYDMKTGRIEIPETRVTTDWLAYIGQTSIEMTPTTKIVAKGQYSYDAAIVATRLRPWIGNNVSIAGKRTEPIELIWTSTPSGNWAESLQAHARIGWATANVIGIELGETEVPLTIENGRFKSQAIIPVSQGSLRWNLDGDVAGDPIVIRQAPDMVLENVAITPQMCQGWLKFVAPLLADVTSVQGRLSLNVTDAKIVPTNSLKQTIAGQLQIHGASVGPGPLADQLLGLVNQIRSLRSSDPAAQTNPNANWIAMPDQKITFTVDQGRVVHKDLQLQAGDITMTTSGSVGIDGSLEMLATIPIRQEWVQKTPLLKSLAGQSLNLPIRGTISRPQADLRVFGQLTAQVAESALQGAVQKQLDPLQKQLDKGLNKLLGPLQQFNPSK